jgi:hypothetical protein
MNTDDFEQRLRRQLPRPIPPEWRSEILSTTHQESVAHHINSSRSFPATLNALARHSKATTAQLSTLLWPSRKAWAAVATIWLVILAVNIAMRDKSSAVARTAPRPARETMLAWKEHERLLTELIGPQEMPSAERPKPAAPRPRSERKKEFLIT